MATCRMLLLLACADPAPEEAEAAPPSLDGECALEERVGRFVVEAYEDYSIADGAVYDAVLPAAVLTEVASDGDCVVFRRENPACDPACSSDQACDFDGACVPYPTQQDVGTVSISGLEAEVSMEPVTPGAHYFDTLLPNPAFVPGARITLLADGRSLDGVGVSPIVPGESTLSLVEGQDLLVTWDAPRGEPYAEVTLDLTVDQHGNTPASLACVFADDGSGAVPATLVDTLRVSGISGFPNGTLSRRTADRAELDAGCVDFLVGTPRSPAVRVDGSTPCDEDADCPQGQSCDLALEICG